MHCKQKLSNARALHVNRSVFNEHLKLQQQNISSIYLFQKTHQSGASDGERIAEMRQRREMLLITVRKRNFSAAIDNSILLNLFWQQTSWQLPTLTQSRPIQLSACTTISVAMQCQ